MSRLRWPAVVLVARVELRRRWRAVVVLGVLAGLVGAVVMGAVQLALRTASAPARLAAATRVDDARIVLIGDAVPPSRAEALPGIAVSRRLQLGVAQLPGPQLSYTTVAAASTSSSALLTPRLVDGRAADPARPDEAVVAEEFASAYHLHAGDTLDLSLLTAADIASFDTGFGSPHGPEVPLRVTGLVRLSRDVAGGNGLGPVLTTPAFAAAHGDVLPMTSVLVRLRDDSAAGQARFRAAVQRLSAGVQPAEGAQEFAPVSVDFPRKDGGAAVAGARTVLVAGLGVLVAVAALAGLLALLQALARQAAAGERQQRVEAALGLTTGERTLARVLPSLLTAGVAVVVAVAGTLSVAGLEPLGALRAYEPSPGWLPDRLVIVAGAVLVAAVVVVGTALTTGRALRSGVRRRGWQTRASLLPTLLRGPASRSGTAFALPGRPGVPVRATLVGAVVGVAGLVAAATFAASLQHVAHTPSAYGWNADFAWSDAKEPLLQQLAADPAVRGLARVEQGSLRVADGASEVAVSGYAADVRKGGMPWTVLAGRAPARDGEVAVAHRLAQRLGVDVGDTLDVRTGGGTRALHVVGRVVLPAVSGSDFGQDVVLTGADLRALSPVQPFSAAFVQGTDRRSADALVARLSKDLELSPSAPPTEVRNLLDLGRLPMALGLFLAALSITGLGHSLLLTTRRRVHDLAVLRVIGFTPRQVAGTLVWMAMTTALVGLVVGIPLGLGAGRVVWHEVADSVGVAPAATPPWAVLGVAVPAVLVVAVAVSLLPARRAARLSPARVLRAE